MSELLVGGRRKDTPKLILCRGRTSQAQMWCQISPLGAVQCVTPMPRIVLWAGVRVLRVVSRAVTHASALP